MVIMELSTRIYLARVEIEKEFLDKYRNSVYANMYSYDKMVKKLRTLKIKLNSGDTYDIDEDVTGC